MERTGLKAVAFLFYHPNFALFLGYGDQKEKTIPGFPVIENYTSFSCNSLQISQPISNNFWQIFFFLPRAPWSREALIICSYSAKQNMKMKKERGKKKESPTN